MALELAFGDDDPRPRALPRGVRSWPPPRRSLAFTGVMAFTFVLFVAPQNLVPALQPLMLGKLAVGLAVVAYVANRALTGGRLMVTSPPVRWALLLAGLAILSIPAGFWPGGSVDVFLEFFGKSLVIFLLIANVVDTPQRVKLLVASMIAWGALAAVVAIGHYVNGTVGPSGERIVGYESALATNPNDLALTFNILLGLGLGLLPALRRGSQRNLLLGAMALLVAGIVVSFSRGGFLTFGVLGAVWTARALRERGVRALAPVGLVVLALLMAVPTAYLERLSTIVSADADATGSAEERWATMMQAIQFIGERPLLGFGLGNIRHVSVVRGGLDRETHNAYLKVGAELGLAGAVVYLAFLASVLTAARRVRRRFSRRRGGSPLGRLAGGVELALIAFAVGALFSPVPYHFYLYYPAGLAVAIAAMAARVPVPSGSRRVA